MAADERSSSISSNPATTFKFPSYPGNGLREEQADVDDAPDRGLSPIPHARDTTHWVPRRTTGQTHANGMHSFHERRGRQKSLSEALRSIHNRRGSVTDNAREIGEALKAPVSFKLIVLCGIWYMASIFSNASSKAILVAFRKPITLTVIQFAFVSSWCIISAQAARMFPALKQAIPALKHKIQPPSRDLIMTTLPLTVFQIGGHVLNSDAMARIPVSLVHTIKGLSPLFTVLAYRFVFRVHYTWPTYLSLVPLTLGVFMACSADFRGSFWGLVCAFASALLFVTQNIVSKRLFNEAARAESEGMQQILQAKKPDKLNLLCYSSGLALLLTLPLWLFSEAPGIARDLMSDGKLKLTDRPDALDHGRLALEYIFNGTFHFAQSLVAFVLLGLVSPVTYSVASLIKRVFVIVFAVVWFGNALTSIQASGIGLTFLGLYLYDRTNDAARGERQARLHQKRHEAPVLPLIAEDKRVDLPMRVPSPLDTTNLHPPQQPVIQSAQMTLSPEDLLTRNTPSTTRRSPSNDSESRWLRPGTKQEDTWMPQDKPPGGANGVAV